RKMSEVKEEKRQYESGFENVARKENYYKALKLSTFIFVIKMTTKSEDHRSSKCNENEKVETILLQNALDQNG
ncbi:unnamed protein product, partial [Heterotrigona itama]